MFSVNYIFLLNISYIFAIITCLGFLVITYPMNTPFQFAADFTEKTLFKTVMVRLLKAALSNKEENLSSLLTEEILAVDKQLLQIEKMTSEVSGTCTYDFM